MPTRFGFMLGIILVVIVLIANVAIYPKISRYLKPARRQDIRVTYEGYISRKNKKYYVYALWLVSGLIVFTILFMIFLLDI